MNKQQVRQKAQQTRRKIVVIKQKIQRENAKLAQMNRRGLPLW